MIGDIVEPAFPVTSDILGHCHGLTVRDYFAIRAAESDIENHRAYSIHPVSGHRVYGMSVEQAKYAYADAMIEARGAA